MASRKRQTVAVSPAYLRDFPLLFNREKTWIIKLSEPGVSLEFLGYSFRYEVDRFGRAKRFLSRVPSAKACAREREKLRGMISAKQAFVPTPKLVATVNR